MSALRPPPPPDDRTGSAFADGRLGRIRWAVAATAACLVLLAAARLSFVSGFARRITIAGPSMAPALLGRHYQVVCGDCRFPFACDAEHVPAGGRAACPNCGYPDNALAEATLRAADRVLIDRWPLVGRPPQRGEVVAFAAPGEDGEFAVKRVAALADEEWAIRGGDLFVGGQIVRKSLVELLNVQLLVHNARYPPRKSVSLPPRWRGAGQDSRWMEQATGFRWEPTATASQDHDWLEYEHWPCTANARLRGVASPITDNDSFNQGETRRTLSAVPDVLLSCRLRVAGAGRLILAAIDGQQRFEVEMEPGKRLVLRRGSEILLEHPLELRLLRGANRLEFGLCDQQVLLAIGRRTIVRHPYERPPGPQPDILHPLAIGVSGLRLVLEDLCVWRDIYYLDPQGLARSWEQKAPLSAGQIAVLGDNQPVSIDSRQFDPPGIPLWQVLGRVERAFWAAP